MADYAKIFKAYDIRGVVPDELDEDAAEQSARRSPGSPARGAVVTVHDMRTSSVPIAAAFGRGAAAQGADVVSAGLGSTRHALLRQRQPGPARRDDHCQP